MNDEDYPPRSKEAFQASRDWYNALSAEERFYYDYELEDEIKFGRIMEGTKELKERLRKDGEFD